MQNILENLNSEQLNAVKTTKGTLLVLAGAGSGKTKVLTSRIAYLVKNGVKPYNILAVTFTNKAAKEMKERLGAILGEDVVKMMWVGTFHSVCGKILRQEIDKYKFPSGKKLDRKFSIYDEQDSIAVIKQIIKKLGFDEKMYQPRMVKAIISNAKNKLQDAYKFATYARDFKSQKISQIYDLYEQNLNNNNAIDFDDMLMLAVNLFENCPDVTKKYYEKFEHILIDEFQDTNIAQYNLIKLLYTNNNEVIPENRSLCVVGDVDQSIYSWRGADFRIILNFQNDFKNCKLVKLEQNYRSTETILRAANSIIENNEQRIEKNLYSTLGKGDEITFFEADDDAQETNYIVSKIVETSKNYNKFAILYRTNAQSRRLEEACLSMGVPYKIYGGLKFYDRKEIKDIIAYLKLIYNTNDSQSLKRIINVPKRSIGDTTIRNLIDYADANDMSLFSAIENVNSIDTIQQRIKNKLEDFAKEINYFKSVQQKYSLQEFISFILEKSGYLLELKEEGTDESEARIENLQEFVNVASEFIPENNDDLLGEFLSQVSLTSELDNLDNSANYVTLMTLHSVKGLEFPIVFLAGLEEGIFPHSKTFNSISELEEERRLMYVGVTRAKEKLYLTCAKRCQVWGEYRYYNQSRFISEIPSELLEMDNSSVSSVSSTNSYKYSNKNFEEVKPVNKISAGAKRLGVPQRKSFYNNTKSTPVRTAKKSFVVKSEQNKKRDEERIKALLANNPMKRKLEEYKKNQIQEQQEKLELERKQNEKNKIFLNVGERVFHDKLGVGHITDVMHIGDSVMYTVDFGKMGKKAMDADYAHLKKF